MELFGVMSQHRDAVGYHMLDYIFLIFVLVSVGIFVMRTSLVESSYQRIPTAVVQPVVGDIQVLPSAPPQQAQARSPGFTRNVANGVFGPYGTIIQSRGGVSVDTNAFMANQLDVSNFYKIS